MDWFKLFALIVVAVVVITFLVVAFSKSKQPSPARDAFDAHEARQRTGYGSLKQPRRPLPTSLRSKHGSPVYREGDTQPIPMYVFPLDANGDHHASPNHTSANAHSTPSHHHTHTTDPGSDSGGRASHDGGSSYGYSDPAPSDSGPSDPGSSGGDSGGGGGGSD